MTLANGAAAIHAALIDEAKADPDAYATVRDFPSGGSAKPPQLHDELKKVVPSSIGTTSGYGMTEAPIVAQTDIDAPDRRRRRLRRGHAERRRDDELSTDGNEVARRDGEIAVKGPQVMRGYVDSSLDADAFTADGFLRTGDLGRFDEHGAILITGRVKDIIIRKGENVSAKEVEDVLYGAPEDRRRRGARHPRRGPRRDGRRVRRAQGPGRPADDPRRARALHGASGLMTQKIPERLEIIDVMPRNPSGKVPEARAAGPDQPPARLTSASKRRCCAGSSAAVSSGCHCTASRNCAVELERLDDAVGGAADDAQAVAELVDRLVVVARRGDRASRPSPRRAASPASSVDLVLARAAGARRAGRAAATPGSSGMCWYSVPPSATLRTWMPRQIASVGTERIERGLGERALEVVVGARRRRRSLGCAASP